MWAEPRPAHIYVADVQLGFNVGPQQRELGQCLKLLLLCGIHSSKSSVLTDLSGRDLMCQGEEIPRRGLYPHRGEGEQGEGQELCKWGLNGGNDRDVK